MSESAKILSREEVVAKMMSLAARHGISDEAITPFAEANDWAYPFIESDSAYHWIVRERGIEFQHRKTFELDELLYWCFENIASDMAGEYELKHRQPSRDSRRIRFRKQIEILGGFSDEWATRCTRRLNAVLAQHPFSDDGGTSID